MIDPPKENFVNKAIERLCKSKDFDQEIDKYDTSKIKLRNKAVEILRVLNSEEIDLPTLRKLTFTGIPDCIRGLRPVVWRLILGALPTKTSEWDSVQQKNLETYENFKKELIVKPMLKSEED